MDREKEIKRLQDEVKELSRVDDEQRELITTFRNLSPMAKFQLGVIERYSLFTLESLRREAYDFNRNLESVIEEAFNDVCYANPVADQYVAESLNLDDYEEDIDCYDIMSEPWFGEGCRD